jgi:hypothetical protein
MKRLVLFKPIHQQKHQQHHLLTTTTTGNLLTQQIPINQPPTHKDTSPTTLVTSSSNNNTTSNNKSTTKSAVLMGKLFESDVIISLQQLGFILQPRLGVSSSSGGGGGDEGLDLIGSWKLPWSSSSSLISSSNNNNNNDKIIASHVAVQCKFKITNTNAISVPILREFESSLSRWIAIKGINPKSSLGIICTNLHFSSSLQQWFHASRMNLSLARVSSNKQVTSILFNETSKSTFNIVSTSQWIPNLGVSKNILLVDNRLLKI